MSVLSLVHQISPPPRIMAFPCVGVDISDTSLKYVKFERNHPTDEGLILTHWGDVEIPAGIVERGNVHDVAKLAGVLKKMKDLCGARYVNISLPEERAYLFETTIATNTPTKDIRNLLEFRLEENVPLSPRDAYFDYDIVGEDTKMRMTRVAVTVYAKDTIHNYYEACQQAGLVAAAFEIEAQAIARASISQALDDTSMIVDFGKTRMGVGIVHRGMLMYASTLETSGSQMSQDMRSVLGDIDESEITIIKNTKGLSKTKDNEAVAALLMKTAEAIADELGIRIHYWHTRGIEPEARAIKKIILCGGSANLYGLPEYLSDVLGIPTERAQVWGNAFSLEEYVPPITQKYSYGYATAIGLALRNFM
ncbi:MAG: pilus assembly protein PilM [Candidatus Pacebacteria bacterium]|nr:pilus assembly protein PilM [Candidatus Paceibacterota bacterium]MCF7857633.1 pilus assembly protein PilM [Candidatus Paceibacterota bacterium]